MRALAFKADGLPCYGEGCERSLSQGGHPWLMLLRTAAASTLPPRVAASPGPPDCRSRTTCPPTPSMRRFGPKASASVTDSIRPPSPCGSSSPRFSTPPTAAARRSPASWPGASAKAWPPARPTPAATARPAAACRRGCWPGWPATRAGGRRTKPRTAGAGAAARSRWWTARPSPCRTRRPTSGTTPSRGRRSPASASRSSAWWCCSRWRRARPWTRPSAPTAASRPANRPCFAGCTTAWRPGTFSWPTATTARTSSWPSSASVVATPSFGCTNAAGRTSAAAGGWGRRTTS